MIILKTMLQLSQRGYSHYEVGHYDLTATLLIKLSKLYNVSADYILGISNEEDINKKNKKEVLYY